MWEGGGGGGGGQAKLNGVKRLRIWLWRGWQGGGREDGTQRLDSQIIAARLSAGHDVFQKGRWPHTTLQNVPSDLRDRC